MLTIQHHSRRTLTRRRAGTAGNMHHVATGTGGEHALRQAQLHLRILNLTLQRRNLLLLLLHEGLQLNNAANTLQGDALLRELLNLLQTVNVTLRIAARLTGRTRRLDQADAVVLAQGLRAACPPAQPPQKSRNRQVHAVQRLAATGLR